MADDSFKEFVLDQLSALPEVRARAMFGAHGLIPANISSEFWTRDGCFSKRTRNRKRIIRRAA